MSGEPGESIAHMFQEESRERLDRVVDALLALERGEAAPDAVNGMLRDLHSIKGAAGMVGFDLAPPIAHAMEDTLAEAREAGALDPSAIDPLLRACDSLRGAVCGQDVDVRQVVDELAAASHTPPPAASKVAAVDGDASGGEGDIRPAAPAGEGGESRSLRVDAGGLDRVVDTVGQAVLHQRSLELLLKQPDGPDPNELDEALHRADLRLDELQHSVIGLRTVPVSTISDTLPRLVRDLAAASHKEVELAVTGAEITLDRAVLEGASEAISHLIRNAVAHGIESPEERAAAGKPERGRVQLRARQHGDRVAIEVSDDGRGVAADLVARAGEGVPLVQVLAEPGLTSAENATELAGRGVGVGAVLDHVRGLGGELEVETETGRGTTFTLLLPISLALLHVLLARRSGVLFALPLAAVVEVVDVREPLVLRGRTSVEVGGEVLPLADPIAVLGGEPRTIEARCNAIVVSAAGARAALVCDELIGDDDVLVKPLGRVVASTPGYLGAAVVAGGEIALVLDAAHVVPAAAERSIYAEQAGEPARRAQVVAPGRILVVDDQFTAREIQRSILEAAGYGVVTARDGREAWEKILGGEDVDLVLTDLEMPQMDGLQLVRAIRDDPGRSSLPIVVVTSRGSEEDERRGLEAGADAYVVKQRFDQRALLDTVERLVAG